MRDDDQLLNSAEAKRILGNVSDMWLHRRLSGDPTFPKPRYVNHLRYWLRSDLVNWIESLPRENPGLPTRPPRKGRLQSAIPTAPVESAA